MAVGTPLMGVNGEITLWDEGGTPEEVTVLEMVSWSIEYSSDVIETAPFRNDGSNRVVGQANRRWTASFEGSFDTTDTAALAGQNTLRTAYKNGTKLHSDNSNRLRIYTDLIHFYTPDETTNSEACCFVSSYSANAAAAEAIKVSFSITGSGPLSDLTLVV